MQEVARRGLTLKYSDDQPREPAGSPEGGQFAGGSGGSGTQGGSAQTNSPAFRAWFKDSKVVDAQGQPLVVYHGTSGDIAEFRVSNTGEFGPGIYFTTSQVEAGGYTGTNTQGASAGPNVMPVYLSLQNPFPVTTPEAYWEKFAGKTDADTVDLVKKAGYDGVAYERPVMVWGTSGPQATGERQTHYVAFSPIQIKSAIGNVGTFNPLDPHIGRSLGHALLLKELRARELWPQYLERLKFSEDQPRDDRGRWTDGGSGNDGSDAARTDTNTTLSNAVYHSMHSYSNSDIYTHAPSGEIAFRSPRIASEVLERSVKSAYVEDHQTTLRAAVQVADVLRDMKAQGYAMPNDVIIGRVSGGTSQLAGATQWIRPSDDAPIGQRSMRITLNINVPEAAPQDVPLNIVTRLAFGHIVPRVGESDIPAFSVHNFKDIVVHEMGHIQAGARSNSGLNIPELTNQSGPWHNENSTTATWFRLAAQEVSAYASKNTDEFLAEAFTVQYRGEIIKSNAQVLYHALEGPKVKR
jgi:hypothetical protein